MNIFKKSIAPITDKAWNEITSHTKQLLGSYLTARNFVDIDGPNGLELGGVSTGRLIIPENQSPRRFKLRNKRVSSLGRGTKTF